MVRAGAGFENGRLVERTNESEGDQQAACQGGHETGRFVGQREPPVRFACLTGSGLRHAGWAGR
jgi:hypothetical protein